MISTQFDVFSLALLLGLLSLLPLIVITTTSFLKISLVMLVLRNAIGVQQVPPTLAIYGMALAMTGFVMAPTAQEIAREVTKIEHSSTATRTTPVLVQAKTVFEPLRAFMLRFSRPEQRQLFLASAKKLWPKDVADEAQESDTLILIPSFVVSELQSAYEIGFLIYIPLVCIDLFISNMLMALGMQQVSPQTLTIPMKLLLFTLVDGWGKLLHALALSYV